MLHHLKSLTENGRNLGISYALGAALLFGISTPLAKLFLTETSPFLLAGLLYLGSGIGLGMWKLISRRSRLTSVQELSLKGKDWPWFLGAVLFGGIFAPVLLMHGLQHTTASSVALLLNLEAVATAGIAWFVFKENVDRRVAYGFALITLGGLILAWPHQGGITLSWGALTIALACLGWGIDNNFTRKVSASDSVQIAMLKGLIAGGINTLLALMTGSTLPDYGHMLALGLLGFVGYGLSLTLFVLALRHIGTARTGAYFSTAPFAGALVALFIWQGEWNLTLGLAGMLMALGVWLHLTEHHEHKHIHEPMAHAHLHRHDEHHQHAHLPEDPVGEPHVHFHHHDRLVHRHRHDPDIHHQHPHK
jgi:drug/metabolite transporter (DMT)-like permease